MPEMIHHQGVEIIAATGHRPSKLGGYGWATEARLEAFAKAYLERAKPDVTISGMAIGWDMAFARASADLGIPFIAAVPFDGQDAKWPPETKAAYWKLIRVARRTHIVSTGGYEPHKMQVRNEWMVDHCTGLAALWDGSSGGTGNCIRYARKVGRPIENLWAEWAAQQKAAPDVPERRV